MCVKEKQRIVIVVMCLIVILIMIIGIMCILVKYNLSNNNNTEVIEEHLGEVGEKIDFDPEALFRSNEELALRVPSDTTRTFS